MAFYSDNTIRTEILEAVVHIKNNRSEFRIPNGDFLSNLKLADIQTAESTGVAAAVDSVGALGVIKNLYLYDGRTELAVLRDFHQYVNWKNLLNKNIYNAKVNKKLKDLNLGYTSQQKDTAGHQERQTLIKDQQSLTFEAAFTNVNANAVSGYIMLKECFAFLANIPILSSKVFKDLRLVVEYNSNSADFTTRDDKSGSLDNRSPLLIVDRVMNPQVVNDLMKDLTSFNYNQEESDRFRIGAINAGDVQASEHVLKAFNNKTVERLRVQKRLADKSGYFTANVVNDRYSIFGSQSGNQEKYQIIANGQPVGPEAEGFKGDNRGLALMTDSWDSLNLTETSMYHLPNDYETTHALEPTNQLTNGVQAFFGLALGRKVNELKIQYTRTGKAGGNGGTQYTGALEIEVVAEVVKSFLMNNGQYQIVYV